ncbi:MAG TPA: NYN domain-containing protein [Gaiellaceae bacterium]|nr:NYN domain-containing protein [Gaiellaceae bacterium]
MAEPTLYLFDGWNLLNAGGYRNPAELRDALASFVALRGARGVLVLDGTGRDEAFGPLEVRWAANADALLERLAAESRDREHVCVVSSDAAIRGTTGQEVRTMSSRLFLADLEAAAHREDAPAGLGDRLDPETRARLERLRRGQ